MKYAVPMHELNTRKAAFKEANVLFEVITTQWVDRPVMEGESAYSASIILKKIYNADKEETIMESVVEDKNISNSGSEAMMTSKLDDEIETDEMNPLDKKPPAKNKVDSSTQIELQLQEGKPISENQSLSRESEALNETMEDREEKKRGNRERYY